MAPSDLPDELPEKPEGWTREMKLHMNFGEEGGAASFRILDPEGREMPFAYQYDTRKGGLTGFALPGVDRILTWADLRAEWPAFVERKRNEPAN